MGLGKPTKLKLRADFCFGFTSKEEGTEKRREKKSQEGLLDSDFFF